MKTPIHFYYDIGALLRFFYAFAVSAIILVILTKISNCSGITVQWKGGFRQVVNNLESYVVVQEQELEINLVVWFLSGLGNQYNIGILS